MDRFLIPYLTADDVINDSRRRQAERFAEMFRREDALPLPPEPELEPWLPRLRAATARIVGRLTGRAERAGI